MTMRFTAIIAISDLRKKDVKKRTALRTGHLILDFSLVTGMFSMFFLNHHRLLCDRALFLLRSRMYLCTVTSILIMNEIADVYALSVESSRTCHLPISYINSTSYFIRSY